MGFLQGPRWGVKRPPPGQSLPPGAAPPRWGGSLAAGGAPPQGRGGLLRHGLLAAALRGSSPCPRAVLVYFVWARLPWGWETPAAAIRSSRELSSWRSCEVGNGIMPAPSCLEHLLRDHNRRYHTPEAHQGLGEAVRHDPWWSTSPRAPASGPARRGEVQGSRDNATVGAG